jgi:hypothetical protein
MKDEHAKKPQQVYLQHELVLQSDKAWSGQPY